MSTVTATPPHRTARAGRACTTSLKGLLPLAIALVAWQLLGTDDSVSFPRPSTWLSAIGTMHDTGLLLPALGRTLQMLAFGLVAATVVGVILGMLIGASARLDRVVSPLLDFMRSVPAPVIVPVAGLLLGPSLLMGIIVAVLAAVWPILLNTITAVRAIPAVRTEMGRTLGLGRVAHVRKIMLPSVAPQAALGVRVAVSITLIVTLLIDILGAGTGVGRILLERQQSYDAPSVFGVLLIVGAFGYLLNAGMGSAERWLFRNQPRGRQG